MDHENKQYNYQRRQEKHAHFFTNRKYLSCHPYNFWLSIEKERQVRYENAIMLKKLIDIAKGQ